MNLQFISKDDIEQYLPLIREIIAEQSNKEQACDFVLTLANQFFKAKYFSVNFWKLFFETCSTSSWMFEDQKK